MIDDNTRYMQYAIQEAERARDVGEVPVGCVIVHEGEIIGKAHNQRETLQDPTAHAEIIALGAAAQALGSWRLEGCSLYVTLEPCSMCAGAAVLSRVAEIVYGADDPKSGACGSVLQVAGHPGLNHRPAVRGGILGERSSELLRNFFASLRRTGRA